MLSKPNLFLVGPMGSGKSAVGKQLARLLHLPFYDSDVEIERPRGIDSGETVGRAMEIKARLNEEVMRHVS